MSVGIKIDGRGDIENQLSERRGLMYVQNKSGQGLKAGLRQSR